MTGTINLKIPFESLSEVINSLDLSQKQQLLEILEQQIFEEEEASYQDDDETLVELQKVRDQYQSKKFRPKGRGMEIVCSQTVGFHCKFIFFAPRGGELHPY